MQHIIDFFNSDWLKIFLTFSGWIIALLVTTKPGILILSLIKHFWYLIINPAIIYSASFRYEFLNVDFNEVKDLMREIYNCKDLEKFKLKRNGFEHDYKCKLHYPGLDYSLEIEELTRGAVLTVLIKETESNYKNLNGHIKNVIIKDFVKNIILANILKKYTTNQYISTYELILKFSNPKYNYFLKERFSGIPKGYVSNALLTVKDAINENFTLNANLNEMNICVKNNFDEFIKILDKYMSII